MWYVLALMTYSEASICPTYTCGKNSSTTGQCLEYSMNTTGIFYAVTPCEAGLLCLVEELSSSTCQQYPANARYPGEYCESDYDCISTICTNHICKGLNLLSTSSCINTADCDAGLYCESSKCVSQVSLGSNCTSDDMCTNDALCDNQTCVQMFSLATGKLTYTLFNHFAPLCISGYAKDVDGNYTCAEAPVSNSSDGPTLCPDSGECTASDNETTVDCECGYNGQAYCPLFEGDSYVQSMISSWKVLFSDSKNNCNGLSRYSFACFYAIGGQSYINYLNWALNASLYLNGTWYKNVNTETCIKTTLLLDYYNLIYDKQSLSDGYSRCPVYEKAPSSSVWPTGQCVYYSKNIYSSAIDEIYQVGSCSVGTCDTKTDSNSTCTTTKTYRFPGEYCTQNEECYSKKCTSNKCSGQESGHACGSNNSYCNPGLFCNSINYCQAVNDSIGCTSDNQCSVSHVCVLGKCTLRYSLADGEKSILNAGTDYGYSVACQSGFASKNSTTGYFYCTTAPLSPSNELLIACKTGSTCLDSTNSYESSCTCGLSGNSYCQIFVGDKNYFTQTITYFNKLSSKVTCYNNLLSSACVMHDSSMLYDYYQFYLNEQKILNYSKYFNAADDVLQVFANEYYVAVNYMVESVSSFASGLILGTFGVILLG